MSEQVNEVMRLLDALEGLCRKYSRVQSKTKKTDSETCSEGNHVYSTTVMADGLRILGEYGNRFRVTSDRGRQVYGYWPENDPRKK